MTTLSRDKIIAALEPYFKVKELVCNHTYSRYGENSWNFLDTDFLHTLLVLRRDIFMAPMVCNTKDLKQRGLRCNRCELVRSKSTVYLSAHVLGKAGDFYITGYTAEQARQRVKEMSHLLPVPVRIERKVGWLHIDVRPTAGRDEKVIEFNG